ncbi:unnamed protein product, partial [Owenia fusiformis]
WNKVSASESAWLKCKSTQKRNLKELYKIERRTFDRIHRRIKRQFQKQEQQHLLDIYNEPNSRNFWDKIGKIGIASDRKQEVPWEILKPDKTVSTDKQEVLNYWANSYNELYSEKEDNVNFDENHLKQVKEELSHIENDNVDPLSA